MKLTTCLATICILTLSADAHSQKTAAVTRSSAVAMLRHDYFAQSFEIGEADGSALSPDVLKDPEVRAWFYLNSARASGAPAALIAIDSFARAEPKSPWPQFARAFTLAWVPDSGARAVVLAKQVEVRMPGNDSRWLQGFTLHRASRFRDVIALVDQALKNGKPWAELYVLKANAIGSLSDSGSDDRAKAVFAAARALDSLNVNAWYLPAANLGFASGDSTKWVFLRQAMTLAPFSTSISSRFWTQLKVEKSLTPAQRDSIVQVVIARALAERPNSPVSLALAAEGFQALGNQEQQIAFEARLVADFQQSIQVERVLNQRIRRLNDSVSKSLVTDTARAYADLRHMRAEFVMRSVHKDQNIFSDQILSYLMGVMDDTTITADSLMRLDIRVAAINKINPYITHLTVPKEVITRKGSFRWAEQMLRVGDSLRLASVEAGKDYYKKSRNVGEYANQIDWSKGTTHDALGWLYLNEGRLPDAQSELDQAAKLIKNDAGIYYHQGMLAEALKDPDLAQRMYARGMPLEGARSGHKNTDALTRLYSAKNGSLSGFDAYVAAIKADDLARRRIAIAAKRLQTADQAPEFSLARYNSAPATRVTNKDLAGKIVVMNFWGVWCGPCVSEIPQIQKFAESMENDSSVVVLTVDFNDERATLDNFMTAGKRHFPVLLDSANWVTQVAKIQGFPTTWFITPDGKIAFEHSGASDGVFDEFMMRVELLKEEKRASP